MEWIATHIAPIVAEIPDLGWQRNSIYLRFGHQSYQKGSTLTEMARLYRLPTSMVFAMGDSHNDIEMLSETHSGIAACPANAVEAIRQIISDRAGLITEHKAGHGVVEALKAAFP